MSVYGVHNTGKMKLLCYDFISEGAKVSEKEFDLSINDYIEKETLKKYTKQLEWNMALGLQKVGN